MCISTYIETAAEYFLSQSGVTSQFPLHAYVCHSVWSSAIKQEKIMILFPFVTTQALECTKLTVFFLSFYVHIYNLEIFLFFFLFYGCMHVCYGNVEHEGLSLSLFLTSVRWRCEENNDEDGNDKEAE